MTNSARLGHAEPYPTDVATASSYQNTCTSVGYSRCTFISSRFGPSGSIYIGPAQFVCGAGNNHRDSRADMVGTRPDIHVHKLRLEASFRSRMWGPTYLTERGLDKTRVELQQPTQKRQMSRETNAIDTIADQGLATFNRLDKNGAYTQPTETFTADYLQLCCGFPIAAVHSQGLPVQPLSHSILAHAQMRLGRSCEPPDEFAVQLCSLHRTASIPFAWFAQANCIFIVHTRAILLHESI